MKNSGSNLSQQGSKLTILQKKSYFWLPKSSIWPKDLCKKSIWVTKKLNKKLTMKRRKTDERKIFRWSKTWQLQCHRTLANQTSTLDSKTISIWCLEVTQNRFTTLRKNCQGWILLTRHLEMKAKARRGEEGKQKRREVKAQTLILVDKLRRNVAEMASLRKSMKSLSWAGQQASERPCWGLTTTLERGRRVEVKGAGKLKGVKGRIKGKSRERAEQ